MVRLHKIADGESGWINVVMAMIRAIPKDDPLGPATISILLDECPLADIVSNIDQLLFCFRIDPFGQPKVTAGSEHYFCTWSLSVRPSPPSIFK